MSDAGSLPFVRTKAQRVAAEKASKSSEADQLRVQLAAMKVERDFWVEQARTLQNHLQTVLRGQATILEQMAHSAVGADDVHSAIAQMGQELRQPLTTVEATMALATAARDGSQGKYTAVGAAKRQRLDW